MALASSPRAPLRRRAFPTPARTDPETMANLIAKEVASLLVGEENALAAVGVSFAGPVDAEKGRVVGSPNLPLFQDVPFREMMAQRLGVPVVLENDARAATLAEHRLGAGQGTRHMVYVTVSTGIGGGIVCGGRLYRGALGAAGEVGHMVLQADGPLCGCGKHGCWEAFSSGTAIARDAQERLKAGDSSLLREMAPNGFQGITARLVAEAARQGDRLASEVLDRAAFYLGIGLVNLVNIFNPQVIVVGGGLTFVGDLLLGPAFRIARERALQLPGSVVEFHVTALGDDGPLRGVLLLARRQPAKTPSGASVEWA